MKLKDSQTYKNLARAYAGECQARTRYEFCEYGFRFNDYPAIADIIDTIAYQEFNHARMIYTYIQDADTKTINNIDISAGFPFREKWDMEENLQLLAKDEEVEAELYASFIETAKKEGFTDIANLFKMIMDVEIKHKKIFNELLKQFKAKKLYKKSQTVVWRCPNCGYEATGKEAWQECPLCKAKQGVVGVILPPELMLHGN